MGTFSISQQMDTNPPGSKMAPKTHTIPRKGDAMALSGKAAKSHPIFVMRNVVSPMRSFAEMRRYHPRKGKKRRRG